MRPLFFLLFFSLPALSSEYNFGFQKVDGVPSDIQIYSQENSFIAGAKKALDLQSSVNAKKINYFFDPIHNTAACVQTFGYPTNYQMAFFNGKHVFASEDNIWSESPLCVGVRSKTLLILKKGWVFSFIDVLWNDDKYAQKEVQVTFDRATEKIIKTELAVRNTEKVFCFPGDYGRFYLTFDQTGKKDLYLLTIEKKQPEQKKLDSYKIADDETKQPESKGGKKFFTIPKILIMSGLVIGLLSIVFKNQLSRLVPFLRSYRQI